MSDKGTAPPAIRYTLIALFIIGAVAFGYYIFTSEPRRPMSPRVQVLAEKYEQEKQQRLQQAAQASKDAAKTKDASGIVDAAVTAELVQLLLDNDLGKKRFRFGEVVAATTGKKIIPHDKSDPNHERIVQHLTTCADTAMQQMNAAVSPLKSLKRINEGSKHFEDALVSLIARDPDFQCGFPLTAAGAAQRSGYPDLLVTHLPSNTHIYLDPKLVETGKLDTSLRSFYYTPRKKSSKILYDAMHLLIGYEHDGKDGDWTFLRSHLIDLSHLVVRLKPEFQSNNASIYLPEARIE